MKITMTNEVESKTFPAKNGKEPWVMRNQVGYIKFEKEKYPRRVMIGLADKAPQYAEGEYEFAAETFQVGKFDRLELARIPVLVPVVKASEKPSDKKVA